MNANASFGRSAALLVVTGAIGCAVCSCEAIVAREGGDPAAGDEGAAGTSAAGGGGSVTGGSATGGSATGGSATGGEGGGPTVVSGSAPPWTIGSVSAGGAGCPGVGSVHATPDQNTQSVAIYYSELELGFPPGPPVQHTSCAVGLTLDADAGYRVGVKGLRTRGQVKLPSNVHGRATTRAFLAGSPGGEAPEIELHGVFFGPYDDDETFPPEKVVWSACGESTILGVDAGLTLIVPDGLQEAASMDVARVDVFLGWEACH